MADAGSIALVADQPFGTRHLGQENQRAPGIAHLSRGQDKGGRSAYSSLNQNCPLILPSNAGPHESAKPLKGQSAYRSGA